MRTAGCVLAVLLTAAGLAAAVRPEEPAPDPAETLACFTGQIRIHQPADGKPGPILDESTVWIQRTYRPSLGKIEEEILLGGNRSINQRFRLVHSVQGADFETTEADGQLRGRGRLIGSAWNWTGSEAEYEMPDGTRMSARETLDGLRLAGERRLAGPDGQLRAIMVLECYRTETPEYRQAIAERLQLAAPPAPGATARVAPWREVFPDPEGHTLTGDVRVIESFYMPELRRNRRVWIYLPPGYEASGERYPVLYMHDGQNVFDRKTAYAGEWEVDETLERLITDGRSGGVIIVAVDNGRELRMMEYAPKAWWNQSMAEGELYADFLAHTLKPYIDGALRTRPERECTGVAGSSMGAIISFFISQRHPDVFTRVGAFSFVMGKGAEPAVEAFRETYPQSPGMRLYLHIGTEEDFTQATPKETFVTNLRRLNDILQAKGYGPDQLRLDVEAGGRHNEASWARRFPEAFRWLFPTEQVPGRRD